MDPNLRNLKDFLTLYNKITEICFTRCVDNLSQRDLTSHENICVDRCVSKFALFNQKMMNIYVEIQTLINERRAKELEDNQKQLQQLQQEELIKQKVKEGNAKSTVLTPQMGDTDLPI